jgi:RNA polymerase sigma-70 factor (ECF subfamily)
METTSATLLDRVGDSADQAAWRRFDAAYGDLIVRYARRLGLQHADAEDLRQIVMTRLSHVLPQFRYQPNRGRFRGFLGRVVRNEIFRHFGRPKRAGHAVVTIELAAVETEPMDGDPRWECEWQHHHLRLAMQHIRTTTSPLSLEVFERLLAGESVDEVARVFGMNVAAVHKVKQRMRDRLKERVAAQICEEGGFDE